MERQEDNNRQSAISQFNQSEFVHCQLPIANCLLPIEFILSSLFMTTPQLSTGCLAKTPEKQGSYVWACGYFFVCHCCCICIFHCPGFITICQPDHIRDRWRNARLSADLFKSKELL